jgi:hypothetical protein
VRLALFAAACLAALLPAAAQQAAPDWSIAYFFDRDNQELSLTDFAMPSTLRHRHRGMERSRR